MGHVVYVRNKKNTPYDRITKKGDRGIWPEKKRLEVLTTFLATGSQAYTAAITKVPEETIRVWRKQEWWTERINEIRNEESFHLDAKLTKVMDKALEAVSDRIENGEYMYDPRTGDIRRVPAKLRDVQKVAGDMIDKKVLLEKLKNKDKDTNKQQITADHLVQLAREFAKFATGKEHIEAKDVTTVYEDEKEEVFDQLGIEEA